ncbi:hypothetical protein [Roseateles chitosanitabidus]|uniref:hypothetical protein n=1 Tax=Roseateles chitosanitabidus TaxID=65048 RepID=UPI0008355C25|nr:hypothetical protein [Roseateles chitosanitabidus]
MVASDHDSIALDRPFVSLIVRRHVEDAAFYWTVLDRPAEATHLGARRAWHFSQLLEANLEGLRLNDPRSYELSLDGLDRWGKAGETFVAMYCALLGDAGSRAARVERVLRAVRRQPDAVLRGAAAALAWAAGRDAQAWIDTAWTSVEPVDLVLALRASALREEVPDGAAALLQHADPHVRAAACRAVGPRRPGLLRPLFDDASSPVRAEAAIAWSAAMSDGGHAADERARASGVLWRAVVEQADVLAKATGWYRVPARRRLDRWLRELAAMVPVGHPDLGQLVGSLPLRQGLNFSLHAGDPALLDFVVAAMRDPSQARWAGWVWQCLTAVDLSGEGLTAEEPPVDLDAPMTAERRDADAGLPLPDAMLVSAHPANRHGWPRDQRMLLAHPVHPHLLRDILDPNRDHAQALRFIAADALSRMHPEYAVDLRATPSHQARQLRRMGLEEVA